MNEILDTEIKVTNSEYAGLSLKEAMKDLSEKQKKMAGNIKYLYQYGGVGGGSGGGSSDEWKLNVYVNGISFISPEGDQNVVLGKPGTYTFEISISKPLNATFNITCRIGNKEFTKVFTSTDETGSPYQYKTTIDLSENTSIYVKAVNMNLMNEHSYTAKCITDPYTFSTYFTDNSGNIKGETENNNFFIEDVEKNGLVSSLGYQIFVNNKVSYTCYLNGKELESNSITDASGSINVPLLKDSMTAGNYIITWEIRIQPDGASTIVEKLETQITLIPSESIFIQCVGKNGTIYNTSQKAGDTSNISLYYPGSIELSLTLYEGINNSARDYTVKCNTYDENANIISLGQRDVRERVTSTFSVSLLLPENIGKDVTFIEKKLTFTVNNVSFDYYVYLKVSESTNLVYYTSRIEKPTNIEEIEDQTQVKEYLTYFRAGELGIFSSETEQEDNPFLGYKGASCIEQTVNDDEKAFNLAKPRDSYTVYETLVHIAIQYNQSNDLEETIMTLYNENNSFDIKQASFSFGKYGGGTIYVPKSDEYDISDPTKYHLITIHSHLVDSKYQVDLYIDSILESSLSKLSDGPLFVDKFKIGQCNCAINLVDVSYITSNRQIMLTTEYDVAQFYYAFLNKICRSEINVDRWKNLKLQYKNMSFCKVDNKWDMVTVDSVATIENICRTINEPLISNSENGTHIPIMLLVISNKEDAKDPIDALSWLNSNYDDASVQTPKTKSCSVRWCNGYDKELFEVKNITFALDLQGSSTMNNKSKNFTLSTVSDEGTSVLYSPNYSAEDNSTFLYEQAFTLKADVVDSSHCNNNAMGSFINKHTNKFTTGQNNEAAGKHIKNCLEGFPFLLFMSITYGTADPECYYLGIYNFNLGRDSLMNLGYVNVNEALNNSTIIETESKISAIKVENSYYNYLTNFGVSEIQGGNEYWDFSQYHDTVLFGTGNASDRAVMWGDIKTGNTGEINSWIKNFVKSISLSGGYIFTKIQKNFGNYEISSSTIDDETNKIKTYSCEGGYHSGKIEYSCDDAMQVTGISNIVSYNKVPNFKTQYKRVYEGNDIKYVVESIVDDALITGETVKYCVKTKEDGTPPHLDFVSALEYYVTCMAFGLVDSVQKNLNIKTWNAGKTFYIAFYDMDTCLGIDNAGSETSYFAFSDYWFAKETQDVNQNFIPSPSIAYRDYYPMDGQKTGLIANGYDIPSSYLFAIVKYLKVGDDDKVFSEFLTPQQLWARWRSKGSDGTSCEYGALLNADKFMNEHVKDRMNGIDEFMWNMNYRTKYYSRTGEYFASDAFSKFHGRRYYQTRDWLNDRIHILDTYFNMLNANSNIQTYSGDTWVTGAYSEPGINEESTLLASNDDVQCLSDIFSEGSVGLQYTGGEILFNVTCLEFSPMAIKTATLLKTYLLGANKTYNIKPALTGVQTCLFSGSKSWTSVSNFAPFISTSGSISIKSKYINKVSAYSSAALSTINLETPSVKEISLTGPYYSATLDLYNTNGAYSSLNSINISGSKMSLNLNDLKISTINLSNIKSKVISIANCNNITNVNLSNATIDNCKLPAWQKDIVISGDTSNINASETQAKGIKELTLSSKSSEDVYSVKIYNDSRMTSLTINGNCSSLIIENCYRLSNIIISEPSKLEKLNIIKCGNLAKNLKISSSTNNKNTANNVFDLSDFTSLTSGDNYYGPNLNYVTKIIFPDKEEYNVKVAQSAFTTNSALKYIDGKFTIPKEDKAAKLFYMCKSFTFRQSDDSPVDMTIPKETKSIESFFDVGGVGGSLELEDAKNFLNKIPEDNSITNINGLFYAQQNLKYNDTEVFLQDYKNHRCPLTLSRLNKVNTATNVFTSLTCINKYMLKGLGSDSSVGSINNNGMFLASNQYITEDSFEFIANKMTHFSQYGDEEHWVINYTLLDLTNSDNVQNRDLINLHNIFNPVDSSIIPSGETLYTANDTYRIHPVKLKYLGNVNFPQTANFSTNTETQHLDLQNAFSYEETVDGKKEEKYIGLAYIRGFLLDPGKNKNVININNTKIDNIFAISIISGSFNITSTEYFNLSSLLDWNTFIQNFNSNSMTSLIGSSNDKDFGSFNAKKYIKTESFVWLIGFLAKITKKNSGIDAIFRNCVFLGKNDTNLVDLTSYEYNNIATNTSVISINRLFSNASIYKLGEDKSVDVLNTTLDTILAGLTKSYFDITHIGAIFKKFPKIQDASRAFQNVAFNKVPYFNFFNKRTYKQSNVYIYDEEAKKTITEEVVDNDGNVIKDENGNSITTTSYVGDLHIYHEYSYNKQLSDLRYCFQNCSFQTPYFAEKDEMGEAFKSYIATVDGNITEETTYYSSDKIKNLSNYYTIEKNLEISDVSGFTTTYTHNLFGSDYNLNNDGSPINNISIYDNYQSLGLNHIFVAPDILYGCANNFKMDYMFDSINVEETKDRFTGVMPLNLLPSNCKAPSMTYAFRGVNVLPRFYNEYNNQNAEGSNYYFIPIDFTRQTQLSGTFSISLILPATQSVKNGKPLYDTFYVFLKDGDKCSIPFDVISLEDGLPNGLSGGYYYKYKGSGSDYNPNIHYNIMGEAESTDIGDSENKISIKVINPELQGINMSYFNKLKLDNLLNKDFVTFYYGRLFNITFDLTTAALSNGKPFANLEYKSDYSDGCPSRDMIWPSASSKGSLGSILKGNYIRLLKSKIEEPIDGYSGLTNNNTVIISND